MPGFLSALPEFGSPGQTRDFRRKCGVSEGDGCKTHSHPGDSHDDPATPDRSQLALAAERFGILAVDVAEPPSRIRAFLQQTPVGLPVLRDDDRAATKAWRARILPTSVLVDGTSRIRHFYAGELDWSDDRQRQTLAALLPR